MCFELLSVEVNVAFVNGRPHMEGPGFDHGIELSDRFWYLRSAVLWWWETYQAGFLKIGIGNSCRNRLRNLPLYLLKIKAIKLENAESTVLCYL